MIVIPKKDDILFYYLKYEGNKLKVKVKVLEYPFGNSFRNVRAVVEEIVESTLEDELHEGDEDIFDLRDLDPKDMPIDEFEPHSVEELLAFSTKQEINTKPETLSTDSKKNTKQVRGGSRRRRTPRKMKISKKTTRKS